MSSSTVEKPLMKILFIILISCVCLMPAGVFAIEENIIQECINNSKAAKSYHVEMYLNDLDDKIIAGQNIHSVDWIIDYVNPDRFSVEQYFNIEKLADKWVTIGNNTFRYYNAFWIEIPMETVLEQDALKFTKSLLLDKYIEILTDSKPINESEDGGSFIINYSPDNWKSFFKVWKFENVHGCLLTVWINTKIRLIEKTLIQIFGVGKEGNKMSLEIGQKFSKYDSNIIINRPKVIKTDKR